MKTLISLTALSLALSGAPVLADAYGSAGLHAPQLVLDLTGANDDVERRGRGRGGRDHAGDDRGGSGGHGGRPRIPGGSGCDDPQDLIEHPECRG